MARCVLTRIFILAFATAQVSNTGRASYIPLDRGPAKDLYNSRPDPSKSGVRESLDSQLRSLKTTLASTQKKNMTLTSTLRRLEVEYTASLKRCATLSSNALPPSALRRVSLAASKSSAVQSLQNIIRELRALLRQRDKHIDGIMRSSEATGLLEVAAARDEVSISHTQREAKRQSNIFPKAVLIFLRCDFASSRHSIIGRL